MKTKETELETAADDKTDPLMSHSSSEDELAAHLHLRAVAVELLSRSAHTMADTENRADTRQLSLDSLGDERLLHRAIG